MGRWELGIPMSAHLIVPDTSGRQHRPEFGSAGTIPNGRLAFPKTDEPEAFVCLFLPSRAPTCSISESIVQEIGFRDHVTLVLSKVLPESWKRSLHEITT